LSTDDPGEGEAVAEAQAVARARALDLLEATYKFPCAYAVTVIAFNRALITEAIKRAAGRNGDVASDDESCDASDAGYESRASREGKYLSHRFAVRVSHAGEVLELHARLRLVEGVVTIL
jgi:putative lipoic acid-binding regulatory protein